MRDKAIIKTVGLPIVFFLGEKLLRIKYRLYQNSITILNIWLMEIEISQQLSSKEKDFLLDTLQFNEGLTS